MRSNFNIEILHPPPPLLKLNLSYLVSLDKVNTPLHIGSALKNEPATPLMN